MLNYMWIATGSTVGVSRRYGVSSFISSRVGQGFPWGTLALCRRQRSCSEPDSCIRGAAVLRRLMGFGKSSRVHTAKKLDLSTDLIEIVGTEEKIDTLLPVIDEMMKGGLVTMKRSRVLDYRAAGPNPGHIQATLEGTC